VNKRAPLIVAILLTAASALHAQHDALEVSTEALERPLNLLVADLPPSEAEPALQGAAEAVRTLEALLDPDGDAEGGVGLLNRAAGQGAVPVAPALFPALMRASDFCRWSGQAAGPLGGELYRLWGLRSPRASAPGGPEITEATGSAACDRLWLSEAQQEAQLAAGSRVDLWGFAAGLAVDRAAAVLEEYGSSNYFIQLGAVYRAAGGGADGRGWAVELPAFPGQKEALAPIWLRDRSLAVASPGDRRLRVPGGDAVACYLHLGRGTPVSGVVAVLASTELALDAQGLATTLFATGSYDGQQRLGNLRPAPAVRWLLGQGDGPPLLVDYRWSSLRR
jgi:thiamine biosynthesis lipoprotein